ncbi:MAG: hypothetical protein AB7N80_11595 [Bdellovibrionales bacterium]
MRVNILPQSMVFEGVLDENTSLDDLNAAFAKLKAANPKGVITLDLSKVARANSSGILTWLKFLKNSNYPFKYVNSPVWLVSQFNMISGYFEGGSFVESFQAPYYAPQSQSSKSFNLIIGRDVPLQQDYSNFSFKNRTVNGEEFEIDFEPEQYFQFIAVNYENFKSLKHG